MKLLNYGSLNYDYVYPVDHMVAPGETLAAGQMQTNCGGKGLNQSVALAKAGMEVCHAGMAGEDGDGLITMLNEAGIDTRFISRHPGRNGHAIIQVNREGENSIILFEGSNGKNSMEKIEEVLENFEAGDVLLLQNEINLLAEMIEAAYARGMKVVLNPSPFNEKIAGCNLRHVSVFLLNEIEGGQMTGETEPERILEKLHALYPEAEVVLTLGKQGVRHMGSSGECTDCPSFPVEAVDTTAAGDTFTGYFIAAMAGNKPVMEALRTASAASAIAVTRHGASVSIPEAGEVEKFLREKELL